MKRIVSIMFAAVLMMATTTVNVLAQDENPVAKQLMDNNDVTVVFMADVGDAFARYNLYENMKSGIKELAPISIPKHVDSMEIYQCGSKESAELAKKYVDQFRKLNPTAKMLSMIKRGDTRTIMYGVPVEGSKNDVSTILLYIVKPESAKIILAQGASK